MDIEQEANLIEVNDAEVVAPTESKKKKINSKSRKKSAKKTENQSEYVEETSNIESSNRKLRPKSSKKNSVFKEDDAMIEETPAEPLILDPSVITISSMHVFISCSN